jgi:signal transduction histidine kinase
VDPAHLLNDIMANLPQDVVRARRLRLETSLSTDVTPVRADATLLRKALHGLITRAIARSELGSTVRVALREQDLQIWIDINDGGAPLAEAELPHAFERSFVGGNLESTGLELATAKAIIDRLGGQVWLRSPGPVGSTITVCLPTLTDQNATAGSTPKA